MPEGHTLHRIADQLNHAFGGAQVAVSSPQGRFAAGASHVDGRRLDRARAWGKHLFIEFEQERWLHVHLGLIGSFTVEELVDGDAEVIGQVRLRITSRDQAPQRSRVGHAGRYCADLRGPMFCRLVTPAEIAAAQAKLGPDPLRPDADPDGAWARIHRSAKPIGELLMDQSVLAGVGNVYRAEVLFRHQLSPFTPGNKLSRRSWELIWDDLVRLLPLGVATSRIVTVAEQVTEVETALAAGRPVLLTDRESYVYRRDGQPCELCGSRIQVQSMAGRNLFWCGNCQRRG